MEELTVHAKERAPQATPGSRRPRIITVIIIIGALVAGVVAILLGR